MAVWIWTALSIAVMMAVLSLTKEQSFNKTVWLINPYLPFVLALAMMGCMLGFVVIKKFFYRYKQLLLPMTAVFIATIVILSGVRAYNVYSVYESKRLTKPIQVTATVQIKELSDSPYVPAYGLPFRQKAVITDIRALTMNQHYDTENPFHYPVLDGRFTQDWQQQVAILPKTLTVLLYSPPHTPTKRMPDDPLAVLSDLTVGKQATVTLSLSPIVPTDAVGFDSYEWLLTRHIHAHARVLDVDESSIMDTKDGSIVTTMQKLREKYRLIFMDKWQQANTDKQAYAVALSLLTGDRGLIDKTTKEQYQYAGISHLLAISGTHVLFLAILVAGFITVLINRLCPMLYVCYPRWQLRWVMMVAVSLGYAVFTGFEVPAKRTVYMLVAVGLARLLFVPWSPFKVLLMTAWLMVWLDPYVLWQAGFWLSFVAVAVLIRYEWLAGNNYKDVRQKTIQAILLQWYVFVAMLPISMVLFGKVSLLGMAVNLLAVGLFGWIVVPLNLLAGVFYGGFPTVSDGIWAVVAWILTRLSQAIDWLVAAFSSAWLIVDAPVAVLVLFGLTIALATARAIPRAWAVIPFVGGIAGLGMVRATSDTVQLRLLATDTPHLSQTVLTKDNDTWLILGIQPSKHKIDPQKTSNELIQSLKKQGIHQLTGVIIQNDDETLAKAIGYVSLSLPINALWQPTGDGRYGNLIAHQCKAGMRLSIDGAPLQDVQDTTAMTTLEVITGWPTITEREMRVCTVFIQSEKTLQIKAAKTDTVIDYPRTAVVIDSSETDRLWGVYQLLCESNKTVLADVFLTHSKSGIDKQAVDLIGGEVMFNNHLSSQEQKVQASQRFATLSND